MSKVKPRNRSGVKAARSLPFIAVFGVVAAITISGVTFGGFKATAKTISNPFPDEPPEETTVAKRPKAAPLVSTTNALPELAESPDNQVEQINSRIQSITTLIKIEKDPQQLALFRIKRGTAYYQLERLQQAKSYAPAIDDFEQAKKFSALGDQQKSYVNYMLGLIKVKTKKEAESKRFFRLALKQDPTSSYALDLSLFLADDAFYHNLLDEALKEYGRFLETMPRPDKIRSLYKISLIYLRKPDLKKAQASFKKVLIATSEAANAITLPQKGSPSPTPDSSPRAKSTPQNKDSLEATKDQDDENDLISDDTSSNTKSSPAQRANPESPADVADREAIRKNSLSQLASISAQLSSDTEILNMLDQELDLTNSEKALFLNDLLQERMAAGRNSVPTEVFNRLLKIENTEGGKVRLLLMQIQQVRTKSLNPNFSRSMGSLWTAIDGFDDNTQKSIFDEFGPEIQSEDEIYISQLSQAYEASLHGKKENSSGPSTLELGNTLIAQIQTYDEHFTSKRRPELLQLWMNVCANKKDWLCVVEQGKKIQDITSASKGTAPLPNAPSEDLGLFKQAALLDMINAYGELFKQNPRVYRAPFIQAMDEYVRDPSREDWLDVAKRLSNFYVADHNTDKALELLQNIDVKEKTEASFYRLQLFRFQSGQFADLIKDDRPGKKFKSTRIQGLRRESFLRQAQQAQNQIETKPGQKKFSDAEFSDFEANIHKFLALSKDRNKRLVALKDYFSKLERREAFDKLTDELCKLKPAERFHRELIDFTKRLVPRLFQAGRYDRVVSLIGPSSVSNSDSVAPDLKMTGLLAQIAGGQSPTSAQLATLQPEQKKYLLGLLALTEPKELERFATTAPPLPASELRPFRFLAAKIQTCNPPLKLTAEQNKSFGDMVPASLRTFMPLDVEKKMALINQKFQQAEKTKSTYLSDGAAKQMTKLLEMVRSARAETTTVLPKADPQVRVRILQQAQDLELKALKLLMRTPLPKGLNSTQADKYRAGIERLATEFRNQATEFKKALVAVGRQAQLSAQKQKIPVKKLDDPSRWPWPTSPQFQSYRTKLDSTPLITSLISLDYARDIEKISTNDYALVRAGLLLSKSNCDFMVEYVYRELLATRQNQVIAQWSRL